MSLDCLESLSPGQIDRRARDNFGELEWCGGARDRRADVHGPRKHAVVFPDQYRLPIKQRKGALAGLADPTVALSPKTVHGPTIGTSQNLGWDIAQCTCPAFSSSACETGSVRNVFGGHGKRRAVIETWHPRPLPIGLKMPGQVMSPLAAATRYLVRIVRCSIRIEHPTLVSALHIMRRPTRTSS